MAKALKIVGTVVAVVGIVATAGALAFPAAAVTASSAATAGGFLGISAASLASIGTIAGLAAAGIGLAAAIFMPKPGFSQEGNPLQFQTNPQSGLPYPIGRTRMSGVRIHADTYDAPAFKSESKQDILSFAVLLGAGGPMEAIETFRADKEVVTFDGFGEATGSFFQYMAQKVSLGLAGASALALVFGGAQFPGWTADHKLSGVAHALWDLRYDNKGNHYGAGVPEPEWIGKWVKVYDPRKDSTYPGGSGSHRALDEATYEWSANPALHALTWCLGRWQNGKRTLGIGAPVDNIRFADFVEAANVTDANQWACGGVEWSTDSKWAILKRMLQAGGAEPTMTGAMIGCRVNMPRVSIATVTGDKLLDNLSIATTRSRRDRFNTVIPRYRSEEHDWEVINGSPVAVPLYVTEDGGPRTKEIDFPLVQMETGGNGNTQAGQLAAYEIVNSREAGPIRFTVGPEFIGVKTGDVITLDVPDEGLDAQPVLIRSRSIEPTTFKITFEAETETDAKHDFALGKTTTPPPTYEPTPPDLTPPTPNAALWTLTTNISGDVLPQITIAGACEFPGADAVLLEYRKLSDADWLTLGKAEASAPVKHTVSGLEGGAQYEARVAYQSGNRIGDWLVLAPVTTFNFDLVDVTEIVTNFNDRNDQNGSPVVVPTIAGDGTAIDHTINANGTADLSFEWAWAGTEADIDGFEVMLYSNPSSSAHVPGSAPQSEVVWIVPADKRAMIIRGVLPTSYYTWAVRAFRVVDPNIDADQRMHSAWVKPALAAENPYRPASNVAFAGDITGTISGTSAASVATAVGNFNARNDRNSATVVDPVPPGGGAAIDHTNNANGSVDISFEWDWSGDEADIDYFQVTVVGRTNPSAYTIGSGPSAELKYTVPPNTRAFILYGVSATLYWTFYVTAYRVVDPDVPGNVDGLLRSNHRKSTASGENPYRPVDQDASSGDITTTISGVAASNVSTAVQNFNGRNDRDGSTPLVAVIPTDTTAVDHTLNAGGVSADISFEWNWGGTEASIDGFEVMVVARTSSSSYTIGSTPAAEFVTRVPANKRAFIIQGVPPTLYYTFAVRPWRGVDPDVNAAGIIYGAWAKPTLAAENPYRPATQTAYTGKIGDTVGGVDATIVAATVDPATGNIATGKVVTDSVANGAITQTNFGDFSVSRQVSYAARPDYLYIIAGGFIDSQGGEIHLHGECLGWLSYDATGLAAGTTMGVEFAVARGPGGPGFSETLAAYDAAGGTIVATGRKLVEIVHDGTITTGTVVTNKRLFTVDWVDSPPAGFHWYSIWARLATATGTPVVFTDNHQLLTLMEVKK